ncbi:MAG: hypothetical protein Q7S92_03775 [Candidatus Diapherotrites archaeon]|nr:hypothetical protein [Candidatus Diapherotrites archaeon]
MNKMMTGMVIGLVLILVLAGCTAPAEERKGIDKFNEPLPDLDDDDGATDVNIDLDLGSIANPIPGSLSTGQE